MGKEEAVAYVRGYLGEWLPVAMVDRVADELVTGVLRRTDLSFEPTIAQARLLDAVGRDVPEARESIPGWRDRAAFERERDEVLREAAGDLEAELDRPTVLMGGTDYMTPGVKNALKAVHGRAEEALNDLEGLEDEAGRQWATFGDAEEAVEDMERQWRRLVTATVLGLVERVDAVEDALAESTVEERLERLEERVAAMGEAHSPEKVQERFAAAFEALYGRNDTPDG